MKRILVVVFLLTAFLPIACKKDTQSAPTFIEGEWETRRITGTFITYYPPGTGLTAKFTGNKYELIYNGQVTGTGTFDIMPDSTAASSTCLSLANGEYKNRIVYNNNMLEKIFIQRNGDTLYFLSGCFAIDQGTWHQYVRQ